MKISKPKLHRPNRLRMTDIRKAVARECIFWEDMSKKRINDITRLYLKQLRKDGFYPNKTTTEKTNAIKVNYIIERL